MKPTRAEVSRYELLLDWKARPEPMDRDGLEKYVHLVQERFEKVEALEKGRWYALLGGKRAIAAGLDQVQVLERELSEDPETFGSKLLSIAEEAFSAFGLTRPDVVFTTTVLTVFPQPVVNRLFQVGAHEPLKQMIAKDVRISTSVLWGHEYALQLSPYSDPRTSVPMIAGFRCTVKEPGDLVKRWRRLYSGLTKVTSWAYVERGVEDASA